MSLNADVTNSTPTHNQPTRPTPMYIDPSHPTVNKHSANLPTLTFYSPYRSTKQTLSLRFFFNELIST